MLVEFDRQIFESIIYKVIVDGYDDGNKDPSMFTFVYKTGFTNSVDANNHKPPRKKRKKNKEKNENNLSSYSPNEDEKMCSLNSDNTCRKRGLSCGKSGIGLSRTAMVFRLRASSEEGALTPRCLCVTAYSPNQSQPFRQW